MRFHLSLMMARVLGRQTCLVADLSPVKINPATRTPARPNSFPPKLDSLECGIEKGNCDVGPFFPLAS